MPQTAEPAYLFISYAEPDRSWAEWVAWELQEAGYEVQLDAWHWRTGDNQQVRFGHAVENGQVLALFSRAYFDARYSTADHWSAVLAAGDRLIPVRIDDTEPPKLLRPLLALSLYGLDNESARRELLKVLRAPGRPQDRPPFPGAPRDTARSRFPPASPRGRKAADWSTGASVLVGVHTYQELSNQPAIKGNLADLGKLLTTSFGIPYDRCTTVDNPSDPRVIIDTIERAGQATAFDSGMLLVYYAGHGIPHPRTGQLLLSVADSRAFSPHTFLPFEQIREVVATSPASQRLVIIDCCYSARGLDTLAAAGPLLPPIEGTFLMASSGATEVSLAPSGRARTAFTDALLDILERGLPGGPPMLDAESLFEGARRLCADKDWPKPHRQVRNDGHRIMLIPNRWKPGPL
ncbi:TIR domain-containing protein [Streptomyces sp. BV286]|uniref:caspase, EACC1-associated type n=1 Tax=unclassified Streptomyces TaxID=2593676 RepID=UPI001C2E48BF|nr:TIR domain-containing protein [Streptomyces sp. BV286]MBV1941868.1 TIR domain-containing protein [Streptomyces sp. BV286]